MKPYVQELPALRRGHIASFRKFWQPPVDKPGQASYGTVDVLGSRLVKCYAVCWLRFCF